MAASCTLPPAITKHIKRAEYSSQYEYFNSWQPRALYRGDSFSSVLTVGLSRSLAGLSKDVKHLTLSPGGPGHMFPLVKV